ncbi:MAG: molybdopterin-dependent oxidoreductase [Caulobacteraceae bacterium]|nr:molybdopterin-dependent oxidoreductase [Caulobacter sp.]
MTEAERAQANLKVHSLDPLNAEPPLSRLAAAFVTPQSDLYIRTHGEVQHIAEADYRLRVGGRVARELELSVAELRERFAPRTVTATLQCAGNRRADLQEVAKTAGDPWAAGAVGNVRWTGVSLREVLEAAGAEAGADLQVAFLSPDEIEVEGETALFGVSIPMAKALQPDVLLAWEMNGEPLLPEHGFPLRAVVPGYAGVRSAKWVTQVCVQDAPAESPIQRKDYKLFPAEVAKEDADWEAGLTIDAMPLNSAICEPQPGAKLEAGPLVVRGWATASGRAIRRVDVSVDGARTWAQAELQQDASQPHAWTLWSLETKLEKGEHELVVRAFDEAMQTQPDTPDDTWNFAGYLATHRHRIHVSVQ